MQNSSQKRHKEPTDMELRNLKAVMQKLSLAPNHEVYYNLVSKESRSTFFNNDRLILLNTKDKYFGYVSKLPEGLIPLLNEDEVKSLKFKAMVKKEEIVNKVVKSFQCHQVPGKLNTFEVFYKRGNGEENEKWHMTVGNPTLMKQWIELIQKVMVKDQPEPEPVPQPIYKPPPVLESINLINESIVPKIEVSKPPNIEPEPPLVPPPYINNSVVHISNISHDQNEHIQSSRIANMFYNDYVEELKYLRKNKPEKFVLGNDLSKNKLENYDPQNNNTLNVHGYKKTSSLLPNQKPITAQGSRNKIEPIQSKAIQEAFGRVGSYRHLSGSQLVRESLNNSGKINLPLQQSNRQQYKPYNTVSIDPEVSIKNSSLKNYQNNRQFEEAFENPITNSRNQLDPLPTDSKKNITIDYQKSSRSDIGYNKSETPTPNSLVKMSDQRESQVKNQSLAKSYLNKFSRAESKKGFSSRGMAKKKWNQLFAETNNKLEIYEEFIHTCFNTVREIVNEMFHDSNRREYLPIEARPPFFTFYNEGIILTLHQFNNAKNISNSNAKSSPLLFDHSTYELLKRQFYNYNLVLAVTANEGFIKVPLCAYFQYKGILVLCKAEVPQTFVEVTPKRYQKQFQIIENQLHLRFAFGSFNSYLHQNQKYIILDNMKEFIPQLSFTKEVSFFRKEFLMGYQRMIEDQDGCLEAHQVLVDKHLTELLGKLESIQTYIVNSHDLSRLFHQEGLSLSYLPSAIQQIRSPYLKRIFLTELASTVFTQIFRSQLNNIYQSFFQNQQYTEHSFQETQQILIDSAHTLINMIFGDNINTQNLWKIIIEQCKIRYKVIMTKEDLLSGYLFGAVIEKMGVQCNFRTSSFDKNAVEFFGKNQNLPKDLFVGYRMKIRRYDLESISEEVDSVKQILKSEPTTENFDALVSNLNLKTQSIPNYLYSVQESLLAYLCNFVPYSQHQQFQHIGIYNMVLLEPHSYYSTKCSLLALKWCVKKKLNEEAIRIFEMKQIENVFWSGEYNPAISQFYDFFAMYNASVGHYDQATQLAKLSLKNTMQVAGTSELPVADKHYQLGNIFFKMGRKEDALRQYSKTKDILIMHQQTQISEFAVIMLKLAILFLNFGKISQSVQHSLEALKIFDNSQGTDTDQIGTFQILSRCYEITKNQEKLENVCDMAAEKFNATEDCLIFQRMLKLMLFVKLKQLSSAQSKAFLLVISKLQEQVSDCSEMEIFSFLNRKCQEGLLVRKVEHFLDNIIFLQEQATKKDLFRRYKSLNANTRGEAEQMLVTFEAFGLLVGFGFMIGSLREVYD